MHCILALCQCGQDEIEVQDGKKPSKSQTRRDVIQEEIESEVEIVTDSTDKINRTNEWSNEHLREQQQWSKYIYCVLTAKFRSIKLPFCHLPSPFAMCVFAHWLKHLFVFRCNSLV